MMTVKWKVPPDVYLPVKVILIIPLLISGVCSLPSLWLQSYSSHLHISWLEKELSQTFCTVYFSACWVIRFVMSFTENKIT